MPDGQLADTLARSLPCVGCGYNLKTLAVSGRCPECGLGVELTISLGGELVATRPAYARRLAWASGMLLGARVAAFAATMSVVANRGSDTIDYAACVVASLLCLVGTWLLTAREHPHLPPRRPAATLMIRAVSTVAAILLVPGLVLKALGASGLVPWLPEWSIGWACNAALFLYLFYPALEMRVMVDLSRRVSDRGLGPRALAAGIAATVSGLTLGARMAARPYGFRPHALAYQGTISAVILCILLTAWLWTAWNCLVACQIFANARRQAAARWNARSSIAGPT